MVSVTIIWMINPAVDKQRVNIIRNIVKTKSYLCKIKYYLYHR